MMCKVKIRNEHIRGTTRVAQASKTDHGQTIELVRACDKGRDEEHILRKVSRTDIPGKRKKGLSKTRWKDACERDLKSTGLRAGEQMDRSRKIINDRKGNKVNSYLG